MSKIKNNDKPKSMIFQIIDWGQFHEGVEEETSDELEEELGNQELLEYKIRLFGRTDEGKSIYVNIDNFTPYFYIEIPSDWNKTKAYSLINYIKKKINNPQIIKGFKDFDIIERKKFYGFTGYKNFKFIMLIFTNMKAFKTFEYWIERNKIIDPFLFKNPYKLKIYESNIEPFIRCMHIKKLSACGWIKLDNYTKYDYEISWCDISIRSDWKNLEPYENNSIQKFVIASYDIECMSDTGNFPVATNDSDPIIQIGTVLSYYGESEPFFKSIITLGGCEKIKGLEDVEIQSYMDEKKILLAWTKLIQEKNPDIITGYNINGFDFQYMYDRAKKLKILNKFSMLSRIKGEVSEFKEKKLASSALGDNFLKYFDMNGRIIIDLMKVAMRDYKLDSFKLDNVASTFIREKIESYLVDESNNEQSFITTKSIYGVKENDYVNIMWDDGLTENKHDQKYKILNIKKDDNDPKIFIILLNGTIPEEVFYTEKHGGITKKKNKTFWCHAKDDVSAKEMFKMQKGSDADRAIIAKYCIMDCVLVTKLLDKTQVLNNNIGMANVCSVPLSYIFMRGQGVKIFSLVSKKCRELEHIMPKLKVKQKTQDDNKFKVIKKGDDSDNENQNDEAGYEGAIVFPPVKGVHYEPIPVLDYASLYPRSMILVNISQECYILEPKYDNLEGYDYQTVTYNNNDGTTTTCRFAKKLDGTKGILPLILIELLDKRSSTKKLMEKATASGDYFNAAIYDGLQLAYKVTANSLYGQVGAPTSPIYMKELAASTTATGRKMLELSRDFIEGAFGNLINFAINDKDQFHKFAYEVFEKDVYHNRTILPKKWIEPKFNRETKEQFIEYFYSKVNELITSEYRVKPKVIYGDSVTGDTPILLLDESDQIVIKTIDEIGKMWSEYNVFKSDIIGLVDKQHDFNIKYKVWTNKGWSNIRRVIRHKTNKQIYQVLTHTGCVHVTEDHSLLNPDGKHIKPIDCKIGTELMHVFPEIFNKKEETINLDKCYIYGFFFGNGSCEKNSWVLNIKDIELGNNLILKLNNIYPNNNFKMLTLESSGVYKAVLSSDNIKKFVVEYNMQFYDSNKHKIIPKSILNGSFREKEEFIKGYSFTTDCDKNRFWNNYHQFDVKSQISALNLYYLVKSLGYNVSINKKKDNLDIFNITFSKSNFLKDPNKIIKIINMGYFDNYVYDLETDIGNFHAGVGSMIVKNTDSVFFTPKIHHVETKEIRTDRDVLPICIEIGKLAGATICKILPEPEEQVYEKTLWPFIILAKKKYVGNLYEDDDKNFKQKSMGIVLKRRDNAKIVKIVVGGIVDYILNGKPGETSVQDRNRGAIEYTKALIKRILRGDFGIDKYIISKTLKANYKNRNSIVHAVLADRIGKRDPGNKPDINERVPFVYIVTQGKVNLQGDRVEDPKYVLTNQLELDYLFYITNQIMKPSIQFLELIAHNPEKLFENYINKEINRRKKISSIMDYVGTNNNSDVNNESELLFENIDKSKIKKLNKSNSKDVIEKLDEIKNISDDKSDEEIKRRIKSSKNNSKNSLVIEL